MNKYHMLLGLYCVIAMIYKAVVIYLTLENISLGNKIASATF